MITNIRHNNSVAGYGKVVVVTRKTQLEELTERFNSVPQARFYLEHAGQDFIKISEAHQQYHAVLKDIRASIPSKLKHQVIERGYLPQYKFNDDDLVITIGHDGLVVNTAKYLVRQPILPVNPDPRQIDGVLLPFNQSNFDKALHKCLEQTLPIRKVSMVESLLDDGQSLLGFNDLFIGARSHVSARYDININGKTELQSSSGIIVSTGAGSTGWMQSVYAGASGVVEALGGQAIEPNQGGRLSLDSNQLLFAVREPFPSKTTGTNLSFGVINSDECLTINSHMTDNGVIFSDGIEADYLSFNAGSTATIKLADQHANLFGLV